MMNKHRRKFFVKHGVPVVCLLLAVATLAVYWQAGDFDFVAYDDYEYIVDNSNVQGGFTSKSMAWALTTFYMGIWHPLTWLSHILDVQLFGLHPRGHHLISVLFHLANTLLLFLIFRRMTGHVWKSGFVAGLFALHPLHVESVAWVSERKDVLSTFFWMLTMWSYTWYAGRRRIARYLLVVLLFSLGLLSKAMLVTLPFVLFLLDFWPLKRLHLPFPEDRGGPDRSNALGLTLEKLPFFALAAMTSAVALNTPGVVSIDVLPLGPRVANALVSYLKYMGKMIFPSGLAISYPYPEIFPQWQIAGAFALLLFISLLAIKTAKQSPYFVVGWLWYLGTMVPVIGLVQAGAQSMADRYTYIPIVGLFVIAAWGIPEIAGSWRHRKTFLATSASVILLIFAALSWRQAGYWKNSIALFEHTISVSANNYIAHNNLGRVLEEQGRLTEATEHYSSALKLRPGYEKAHFNLGLALEKQGRIDEAVELYREALRIKPDFMEARNILAMALSKQGRTAEAVELYREALRIKPGSDGVHINLGVVLENQGYIEKAIEHYREALRINPDHEDAHYNLGGSLARLGRIDEAIEHYREALRINPDSEDTHNNLGAILARLGRIGEAIGHYREALRIKPDFQEARYNLDLALEQ